MLFNKEFKISLLLFIIFLVFIFASQKIAFALTGNYSKNTGDALNVSDWNNIDNDFVIKSGDTLEGNLNMNTHNISNLGDPVSNGDAVNKGAMDSAIAGAIASNLDIKDSVGGLKVYCGRTEPGATNWIQGALGKYVDIDISAANFVEGSNPYIFTSLGGLTRHWISRGATSISSTVNGTLNNLDDTVRIYILDDNGVDWDTFISRGWYINYCVFGR